MSHPFDQILQPFQPSVQGLATAIRSLIFVNLGFNYGAELPDREQLMEGTGQLFRHIKMRSMPDVERPGVRQLLEIACKPLAAKWPNGELLRYSWGDGSVDLQCIGMKQADRERLEQARLARLATANREGTPHCVPVCFVLWEERLLIALDQKPKTVPVHSLRRVRNILENPRVTLLIDHYEEDWAKLWFVMVEGHAGLVELTPAPLAALRQKYPQYRGMTLTQAISIEPTRCVSWTAHLDRSPPP